MLSLLKEKSKIGYKPKDRKKFKPYMPDEHIQDIRSNVGKNGQPPK